jgi:two-component system sensor histidine kinase DesK
MNLPESIDRVAREPVAAGVDMPRWAPYVWLVYLAFLFMPLVVPGRSAHWLAPTLLTLPVFLLLYYRVQLAFRAFWAGGRGRAGLLEILGMAVLGYALLPINYASNTYLIYAAALIPLSLPGLVRPLLGVAALLALYAGELALLGALPTALFATSLAAFASATGNVMLAENRRKNVALRLSHDEIRRLAMVAERERIGRDLHDLLGHTLSLIAIKSELAGKLLDRDRDAAAREVEDVTQIAREALKQVRTAVTGIRYVALETELASAGALLESSGVALTCERADAALPVDLETAMAMIVREAVTNIHRHAGAKRARIEVTTNRESVGRETVTGGEAAAREAVVLVVTDDGCGGVAARGNGLAGIGERVHSFGGTLEIDSPRGKGTTLRVRLPCATLSREVSGVLAVTASAGARSQLAPQAAALPPAEPAGHGVAHT